MQDSLEDFSSSTRLGTKIINCKNLSYTIDGKRIIDSFTYNFQRYERVGIVGANGIGKTTFLKLLLEGEIEGVERGESIKIGWYRQEGIEFNEDDTVLDIVPDTYLLGKFLFPHDMYPNKVARLSGGERRRLYLLTVLMTKPNLLVLDEPTNDLDIVTLNILEEYLLEFKGTLIIVTHDRHFLDRLADHLLVFCGNGQIKDFIGGYSEYRTFLKDLQAGRRKEQQAAKQAGKARGLSAVSRPAESAGTSSADVAEGLNLANAARGTGGTVNGLNAVQKRKLSYKEKRKLEAIEKRLAELEEEKASLEQILAGGSADYDAISKVSARYAAIKEEMDEKEMRWLELSE